MTRVHSNQTCCPQCESQELEVASCAQGMKSLGGYTVQCIECDWVGYKIQLKRLKHIKTAKQASIEINEKLKESGELDDAQ